MKQLDQQTAEALSQEAVPLVQLVHLGFPSGAILLNSSNWTLEWAGQVYQGAYGLGTVGSIDDGPGEVKGLRFNMSAVASDQISLALDGADEWQGAPVVISTAVLGQSNRIADVVVDWKGYGDTLGLVEDSDTAHIEATAESTAVDLLRGNSATYSDADQQTFYPGDLAFAYVVDQIDQQVVWPAKNWYYR